MNTMRKAPFILIALVLISTAVASASFFDLFSSWFGPSSPTLISSYADPLKVRPGDSLKIVVEVQDDYGIINAKALFTHEKGTDEVPMTLTGTAPGERYAYASTWIVHDTLNERWYNTSVILTNSKGKTLTVQVPWQDPTVSHPAEQIQPGVFQDGNFTFRGSLTVNGTVSTNGSLGIGTSTPSTNLHIRTSGNPSLTLDSPSHSRSVILGTDQGGTAPFVEIASNSGATAGRWQLIADTANSFQIAHPGENAKLTMTTSGAMALGRSDPVGTKLEVFNGALCVDDSASTCPNPGTAGTIYAESTTITEIDLAERFVTVGALEPGDVVVIDSSAAQTLKRSMRAYDPLVAGVVSTKPGIVLGGRDEQGGRPIALAGRVPVKVIDEGGPIGVGDFLTTSSTPGHAMKFSLLDVGTARSFEELRSMLRENERRRNTIVGKALEPWPQGAGELLALITLQ